MLRIILTNNFSTIGIGAGQPSRIDSCKIATSKAKRFQPKKIKDSIAPRIKRLIAYPIREGSRINRSVNKQTLDIKKDSLNHYRTNRISASGSICFLLLVLDLLLKELNKTRVYII